MTDNRDDFEFLDGDALGEEVGDDALPGTADFPPDRALGVEDPTIDEVDDDVETRDLRIAQEATERETRIALVEERSLEGLADDEAQEIGSAVDVNEGDLSPEERALHIVEDSDGS
jgi:hypothetical protein